MADMHDIVDGNRANGSTPASAETDSPSDEYRPPALLRHDRAVFDHATGLLEETIIPPPDSVDLYRTPTTDYISRFLSPTPHIAELFHCNSRIAPCSHVNTVLDQGSFAVARDWFYSTALKPDDDIYDRDQALRSGVLSSVQELADRAGVALQWFAGPDARELAYALDILVLDGARIWRVLPGFPEAWLERTASPQELSELPTILPELALADPPPIVFVAGAPWRYMMLQGPRGYRRTLLDAGRLVAGFLDAGRAALSPMRTSVDFLDVELDRLLRLDGIERSVLVAIALDPSSESEAGT
jgi:hypothetical protein